MTPAPPNNPGHQEAQGRRSETTTQRPPWEGADDSLNAETVLNALDALLNATSDSYVVIDRFPNREGIASNTVVLLVAGGETKLYVSGANVLEALQKLVR